jgi:hypothetical protein
MIFARGGFGWFEGTEFGFLCHGVLALGMAELAETAEGRGDLQGKNIPGFEYSEGFTEDWPGPCGFVVIGEGET